MGGQLAVGGELDSLVGGFGGNGGGIGNDERDDEFAFVAHDHGVQDVRTGFDSVFPGWRCNKFTRRRLDQVFLAIGDEEIAIFVHVSDVAGAEPAVFAENFAGGVGIFIVALHVADRGGADLEVGDRFPGTAHAIQRVVAGDDRRGFR